MTTYTTEQAVNCHILRGVNGTTALVYNYLRNAQALAEHHGRAWITPRVATIAQDIGRHARTVQRALATLRARGALITQARFVTAVGGLRRQISNRLRLVTNVVTALDLRDRIAQRAAALTKYRGDKHATPRTASINNQPQKLWITTPLYRQLMAAGLKKGSRDGS